MESATVHLLQKLDLPDRFEGVRQLLGPAAAGLIVAPPEEVLTTLETGAINTRSRGEGLFLPLFGPSGAGKTTLASSLSLFRPALFHPTIAYSAEISYDALVSATQSVLTSLPQNSRKLLPLNLDHREGNPPTDAEISAIKRFLRAPSPGARCCLIWPETDRSRARDIGQRYTAVAGESPVALPVEYYGPSRSQWVDIALNTMRVCNNITDVEDLGVSPASYDTEAFPTIGAFLRRISVDFHARLVKLLSATRKPLSMVVAVSTNAGDPGVLTVLTNKSYNGLLDARALVDSTPESVIGKWWAARLGLLSQTILHLNARAFVLAPPVVVSCLQMFGSEATKGLLKKAGGPATSPSIVARNLSRSDFGKYLIGKLKATSEDRGTPASSSEKAYVALAAAGFTAGKDKSHNQAMAEAIRAFLHEQEVLTGSVVAESQLDFCPLIPDNTIQFEDNYVCVEYTWRKGNWLDRGNKSAVSQYILTKLKNYARELGWVSDV